MTLGCAPGEVPLAELTSDPPSVLFVVEVPTPQRAPVFNELTSMGLDVAVLYLHRDSEQHGWGPLALAHRHSFVRPSIQAITKLVACLWRSRRKSFVLASFGYRGSVRGSLLMAARLTGVQVVTRSDSNISALKSESRLKLFIRMIVLRAAFPERTRIWTVGVENDRYWREYVGRRNTFLIPYSMPTLPASLGLEITPRDSQSKTLKFIYVGRLVQGKALDMLLQAFMSLKEPEQADWRLVLIGGGPEKKRLEHLARADARISLVGSCPFNELDRFYTHSDVLVLPSTKEAWGLVVNEALAFGLWVIASDQVGARELLTDSSLGACFEAGNQEDLRRRMLQASEYLRRVPIPPSNPSGRMAEDLSRLIGGSET